MAEDERRPLALAPSALDGLKELVDSGDKIAAVIAACGKVKAAPTVYRLSSRIAEETKLSRPEVRNVLVGLLNINRLRRGLDGAGICELLTESMKIEADDEWLEENLERWIKLKPVVASAIDAITDEHPVVVSQKAESLLYCEQNILISCRIITDARPVFNTVGDKILGTTIIHSLSAHYSTGNHNDHATICIAMEADDIDDLQQACVRAKKADALSKSLSGAVPILSE